MEIAGEYGRSTGSSDLNNVQQNLGQEQERNKALLGLLAQAGVVVPQNLLQPPPVAPLPRQQHPLYHNQPFAAAQQQVIIDGGMNAPSQNSDQEAPEEEPELDMEEPEQDMEGDQTHQQLAPGHLNADSDNSLGPNVV